MGVLELMTILFMILKATGLVAWSWWTVFAPLIVAVVFYVGAFIYGLFFS